MLLCRRRRPDRQAAAEAITENFGAKVLFVFPLDFSHGQQALDEFGLAATNRVARRIFVFDNVAAFELSRAIHWRKPSANETKKLKGSTDDRSTDLPPWIGRRTEFQQHLTDKSSMMPFFLFDLMNTRAFVRIADRMPVASVSICGSLLTGISQLQNMNESGVTVVHVRYSIRLGCSEGFDALDFSFGLPAGLDSGRRGTATQSDTVCTGTSGRHDC